MKNSNVKSFVCGLLISTIGFITIVYAVDTVTLAGEKTTLKQIIYGKSTELKSSFDYNSEDISYRNNIKGGMLSKATYYSYMGKMTNKKDTDKKALDIMQRTGNWSYVESLFPYMTPEGVRAVVNLYIEKTGNYEQAKKALPFMKAPYGKGISSAPKTKSDYDKLASKTFAKNGSINSIMGYIPYMSTGKVDKLVNEYIDKTKDFNCSYSVRQYMSTKGIDVIVKRYIQKTGDYGTVAAMLQFMSSTASNYIAKKYISEEKDQRYRKFFTPYL